MASPRSTHPVHDGRPPLHGDALEDGEHGQEDVVEGGDAVVGSLPLLHADGHVLRAGVGPRGGVLLRPLGARVGRRALLVDLVCGQTEDARANIFKLYMYCTRYSEFLHHSENFTIIKVST